MAGTAQSNYKEVYTSSLQPGMAFKEDIINAYGNVLIPAGTVIEDLDRVQHLLEQHHILQVKIKDKEVHHFSSKSKNTAIETKGKAEKIQHQNMVTEARAELQTVQKKLQGDFDKIVKGEAINQSAIKDSIQKTLKVFNTNMNVFQLIEKLKGLDDITYAHSQNVTIISYALGKWLELSQDQLQQLTLGAMLIDIGKMKLPQELLNKKETLTHDERLECQKHVIYSHELIKSYEFIDEDVKKIVLFHHERVDGSGYPMGLKENKIPLLARIVAVADVYNALTSDRPYRSKLSPFEAIKVLETEYKGKLDPKILYIFLNRIGNCFIGQRVRLNDGRIGEIIFIFRQCVYRPMVKLEDGRILDLNTLENNSIEIVDFI
ncbi:HD-GYP domain-containing protein [Alkaliphilus crotonatoxidans]